MIMKAKCKATATFFDTLLLSEYPCQNPIPNMYFTIKLASAIVMSHVRNSMLL